MATRKRKTKAKANPKPKIGTTWKRARIRRLKNGRLHVEVLGGVRRGNPTRTYSHKYAWGRLTISADFTQAGSPILYSTDGDDLDYTPFNVANAGHSPKRALALVNRWLRAQ